MTGARLTWALISLLVSCVVSTDLHAADDYGKTRLLLKNGNKGADLDRLRDKNAEITLVVPELGISIVETTLSAADVERQLGIPAVEFRPFPMSLFDADTKTGCNDRDDFAGPSVPDHVCRLVGTTSFAVSSATPTVWVLDSGIDQAVIDKGLLNLIGVVDCTAAGACAAQSSNLQMTDDLGHGTMVAGI